jgi:CheY-like chemotaxis protein
MIVVEPNEALLRTLVASLAALEVQVAGCRDFQTFLEAVDASRSLDLVMLDAGASDLAQRVADFAAGQNVPLLVLAPLGVPASEQLPALPGEWRRLPKPVHEAALVDFFDTLFSTRVEESRPSNGNGALQPTALASGVKPGRILVVEDNPVNQKLIRRMLTGLGFDAAIAANGQSCLDACASEAFDLIFMDIQMPGMDGFETTRLLRERGDGTWIVALTAHVMNEDRERAIEAGMNDFLPKPIRIEALNEAIAHFVAARTPR